MIPQKVIILLLFMIEIQVINSKLINRKKHKVIETEHDFKLNKAVNSITKDNRKLDVIDTEAALNQGYYTLNHSTTISFYFINNGRKLPTIKIIFKSRRRFKVLEFYRI